MSLNTSLPAEAKVDSASDPAVKVGPPLERVDLALVAILALASLALFWKVIFTSSLLFFWDVFNYTYPSARFIQEMCRHGSLPYWIPYLNYGQPFLENPNHLFFYPYTLFILLLPINLAYPLHYVFHFTLGGVGTYLLARRWNQTRVASFFSGFVFEFSGPLLSLGNLYNHAACAAWIPWALLATDRAVQSLPPSERRGLRGGGLVRPWILLTLVFSLQFLAAEPLTFLATVGLCLAYALYLRGTRRPLISAANLRILTGFALAGCLMVALCAVQFLPSVDLLSHSRRGAQGLRFREETSSWSLHPLALMEVVAPDFYAPAKTSAGHFAGMIDDFDHTYLISLFIGCVPLFFALAGWALSGDRRRNFVAGALLVILALSFGHFTPVFSLAYLLIPPLALVRFPIKLLIPVVLLLALLSGWGLDTLRGASDRWSAQRKRILVPLYVALIFLTTLLFLAWVFPKAVTLATGWALQLQGLETAEACRAADSIVVMLRFLFPGLIGFALGGLLLVVGLEQRKGWTRYGVEAFAALGLVQLVLSGNHVNATVPKIFYTYRPPVLSEFNGPLGSYRVAPLARYPRTPFTKGDAGRYLSFQSIPEAAQLPESALGAFYDKLLLATGAMSERVEANLNLDIERSLPPYLYDLMIFMASQAPNHLHVDCLLGRTNVRYVIRSGRWDSAGSRLIREIFNGSPKPGYLYENLYFVPRAYVAGTSIFTTSPPETLRRMASPDFDALGNVILAADPGDSPAVQGSGPAGRVEIIEHQPNRVTLTARLSRPGYVVLLDRYDSNWHAQLDGRETPVLRANQLFRAVYAEPGPHVIVFYYRQQGLLAGMCISALTVMALLWVCLRNPDLSG
jgi:hypothetical protein